MTFVSGQRQAAPWSAHHWWGLWDTAAALPNSAGSPDQLNDIQKGDIAFAVDVGKLFLCTDATPGAAIWVAISAGGAGTNSWEKTFSGILPGQVGASSGTLSDNLGITSTGAGVFGQPNPPTIDYPVVSAAGITAHKMLVQVISNSMAVGATTFVLQKNGVATGLTLDVPAGATGQFSITATAVYAAGDTYTLFVSNPGGGMGHVIGAEVAVLFTSP